MINTVSSRVNSPFPFEGFKVELNFLLQQFCISKYNEIYVCGWNCNDSDKYYLTKIIDIANNANCSLYLNNYKGDGCRKAQLWKDIGFDGKIELINA